MSIGVGLIGYGLAGRYLHAPFLAGAGFDLKAVATSRFAEVSQDFPAAAVVSSASEVIGRPDVDLVVIAAPNDVHAPLATQALKAGKHVVVDKPMTITVAEADALIDTAEQAGRILSVYQNRRWDGDFLTVEKLLRDGTLGTLALYETRWDRFRPQVQTRWRETEQHGGGILIDLGPHLVDQTLRLFGWPEWVQADVLMQRSGAEVEDGFSIRLGYGRMRAVLEVSSLSAAARSRFHVHGDRGAFVKDGLDSQEAELRAGRRPHDAGFGNEPEDMRGWLKTGEGSAREPVSGLPGRWMTFWETLAAAINSGAPSPVEAAESRDAMAILETARESASKGRRLVPPAPRSARYASGGLHV